MKLGPWLWVGMVLSCGETSPSSVPDANNSRGGFAVATMPGLEMGSATGIHDDVLILGIPGDHEDGIEAGAVRVLDIEDGTQLAVLRAPEPAPGDRFGAAVAIAPGSRRIAVGAPGTDAFDRDSGTVYVFEWTGSEFGVPVTVVPEGIGLGDRFGSSVALVGDVLAVGASGDERGGLNAGAVYLFDRAGGSWTLR